jgi:hypothetical protein
VGPVPTITPATEADLPEAADLAVLHSGRDQAHWLTRFADAARQPDGCLLIARQDGHVAGYGRLTRFGPPAGGPSG